MTRHQRGSGEQGQAAPLLFVCLLAGIAFLGLAVDGARLFLARRDLYAAVDAATLAGASELDEQTYRATDGATVQLDSAAAQLAASETLAAMVDPDAEVDIAADPQGVSVAVRREIPTLFLRVIGIDSNRIGADARSGPAVR